MISSISPFAAQAAENNTGNTATPPKSSADTKDPLTSKDTFLRLLVTQIQNQNPLDPSNPIEFMTQLTQFSNLEQSLASREELASIRSTIEDWSKRASAAGNTETKRA